MRTFTLDTNCLIAIDERRPEAADVRALADAHAAGKANVAVVAMSASEKQKDGRYVKNFEEYRERSAALGLAHLDILKPMAYWDIGFWDMCLWSDRDMQSLEKQIHTILFPTVEFSWQDYCRANGLDPAKSPPSREYHNWRNRKCDVQAIWSHIQGKRDVFVTTDGNFFKATEAWEQNESNARGAQFRFFRARLTQNHQTVSDRASPAPTAKPNKPKPAEKPAATQLLDINTATEEELRALKGVGDIRAADIIKNRPYKGKDELVQKNIIPAAVYAGIKDKIIAKQQ